MEEKKFEIDDLIIRYLSGELSDEERKSLSDWLKESPENNTYFTLHKNVWLATSQASNEFVSYGSGTMAGKPVSRRARQDTRKVYRHFFASIMKVAAVLVIALAIGSVGYFLGNKKMIFGGPNDVIVESLYGSKASTTLPDGTKVWLNGGSKLTYTKDFNGKAREVGLSGEAYFNVVTNPSKPFIVKTGGVCVKALGTAFNVKSYPEDKTIITTLVKGEVTIEGKDNLDKPFRIQMKPEETVIINKALSNSENTLPKIEPEVSAAPDGKKSEKSNKAIEIKDNIKTELYTSWKDTRWIIEMQDVGSLVKDIERRYNVNIRVLSPEIKKFHFTGTIQNETVEQIMVILRSTIPMKYSINKGTITIDEDKQLMHEFNMNN